MLTPKLLVTVPVPAEAWARALQLRSDEENLNNFIFR